MTLRLFANSYTGDDWYNVENNTCSKQHNLAILLENLSINPQAIL